MKRYANIHALIIAGNARDPYAARSQNKPDDPVYAYDENELERVLPPESIEERTQRVERVMLAATSEWMRLTGQAEPPIINPKTGEFTCTGCGGRNGVHDKGCHRVRRDVEDKLQAACAHLPEYGATQTLSDPPGPPCCARCGARL